MCGPPRPQLCENRRWTSGGSKLDFFHAARGALGLSDASGQQRRRSAQNWNGDDRELGAAGCSGKSRAAVTTSGWWVRPRVGKLLSPTTVALYDGTLSPTGCNGKP